MHHFTVMKGTSQFFFAVIIVFIAIAGTGCANIMPPTGGSKDTIPPRLVSAAPPDSSRNVSTNHITLTFDEYVDVQNAMQEVIVSPTPLYTPLVERRMRTVTVRLRDTLEPNTTYTINFGNAIKDVNEANVAENFTYVFSTGNTIDENEFAGKVVLAETGKTDSTLIVILHSNLSDTAIRKLRPRYYTKLDKDGNFRFSHLPKANFAVYVLPNDYTKRYDDSTKPFAFLNQPVTVNDSTRPVILYAYHQYKRAESSANNASSADKGPASTADKRIRYVSNFEGGAKDLLTPLELTFNRKIQITDTGLIQLTDSSSRVVQKSISQDTSATKLIIRNNWIEQMRYRLIIAKNAISDSAGTTLPKADTISFTVKKESEYGSIRLRFPNADYSKNPVLLLVQNETIVEAIPITQKEWYRKLYNPGEYDLRLLYDTNKNGVWDTGDFSKKKQPEIVQQLSRKLTIKANWDNETDINL